MLLLRGLNLNSGSVPPEVTSHSLQEAESSCYPVGCKNSTQRGDPDLGFRTLRDKVQGCAVELKHSARSCETQHWEG